MCVCVCGGGGGGGGVCYCSNQYQHMNQCTTYVKHAHTLFISTGSKYKRLTVSALLTATWQKVKVHL